MINLQLWGFALYCMLICSIGGCWIYDISKTHKRKMEELRKRMADKDLCVCRHERWYHQLKGVDPLVQRCYEFAEPQDHLKMCPCPGFKMDNLLYLERKLVERGRD